MPGAKFAVVDNFSIEIIAKEAVENTNLDHLFFINLGGYKENEFEEYHYKIPNCCTKA
jgi:hypothetical protein